MPGISDAVRSPRGRSGSVRRRQRSAHANRREHGLRDYLGISAEQLSFSRDGQWLTYVTYPESVIWRSRIDGTQRQQLTLPPLQAAVPQWSPDGRLIAFQGRMPGGKEHLYVIPAEGGGPEAITRRGAAAPTWSPDGNSLIFFEVSDLRLDCYRAPFSP